jgi:hypothetical protein
VIKTIKDLNKILKLCRKYSVSSIKLGDVEFQLVAMPPAKEVNTKDFTNLELPPEAHIPVPQYQVSPEAEKILTEALTEEQLLLWSARPEDPSKEHN